MKKIGTPQHILWLQYLDCKKRTKKKVSLPESDRTTPDERLVRFILENSSITERQGERSFSQVSNAVNLICKQLCPGQWCTRRHCGNYSTRSAYSCTKTRPSVCKEYKMYIEKKEARESARNQTKNEEK